MSLQATEAVLLDMDKEGNIVREDKIKIDLVQRGDILKVLILLLLYHYLQDYYYCCCIALSSDNVCSANACIL